MKQGIFERKCSRVVRPIRERERSELQAGGPATRWQALQPDVTLPPLYSVRYRRHFPESHGSSRVTQASLSDHTCSPSSGSMHALRWSLANQRLHRPLLVSETTPTAKPVRRICEDTSPSVSILPKHSYPMLMQRERKSYTRNAQGSRRPYRLGTESGIARMVRMCTLLSLAHPTTRPYQM